MRNHAFGVVAELVNLLKIKIMGLNKHKFYIQVIALPITWLLMILKVLVTVPAYIVAKCNDVLDSIE